MPPTPHPTPEALRGLPDALRGLIVRTPAKLNLFLELHGKRPDGYHELETVMIPVSRFDTLHVRATAEHDEVRLRSRWLPSPAHWSRALGDAAGALLSIADDSTNLIHLGASAAKQLFRFPWGIEITAGKRIPAGAGMGGASSDAAAAILAVATLAGADRADPRLAEIAASIGSDVPFFLGDHPPISRFSAALATGRGERLRPIAIPDRLWFVVAFPRGGLSTAKVYAACQIPDQPVPVKNFLAALTAGSAGALHSLLLNRLSQPARNLSPLVGDLLSLMEHSGLTPAMMTGSGSACFALCEGREDARQKGETLRKAWSRRPDRGIVMVLSSVSRRPALRQIPAIGPAVG